MVGWLLLVWTLTAIEPFNRRDWLLENLLVFLYAGLLAGTYRRFAFSNLSYGLFTLFLSLHLVGAHYTYEHAPPGSWLQALLDVERNHYDRVVHFAFGLLLAYPFREILLRAVQVRPAWSYFLAVNGILAFSAYYELLEGAVATIVSPELGAAYLGTQGDSWDAQKDSFLALCGATLAMLVTRAAARRSAVPGPRQSGRPGS
jgi:putative membrane protein